MNGFGQKLNLFWVNIKYDRIIWTCNRVNHEPRVFKLPRMSVSTFYRGNGKGSCVD